MNRICIARNAKRVFRIIPIKACVIRIQNENRSKRCLRIPNGLHGLSERPTIYYAEHGDFTSSPLFLARHKAMVQFVVHSFVGQFFFSSFYIENVPTDSRANQTKQLPSFEHIFLTDDFFSKFFYFFCVFRVFFFSYECRGLPLSRGDECVSVFSVRFHVFIVCKFT